MRIYSRCCGALLLMVGLPFLSQPSLAFAQDDDPDARAYRSYTLTMPKYKKFLAAMVNLAKAGQTKPEVKKALETATEASIDDAVAQLNAVPAARGAIADAGLTPRDFMLILGASLQAQMANYMIKEQGASAEAALKDMGASPAQLAFYQKNEAEIARLNKEAEAKAPSLKLGTEEKAAAPGP